MSNQNNGKQKILVFDIETVPDDTVCLELTGEDADTPAERRQLVVDYHIKNGIASGFVKPALHKVVAIGVLIATIKGGPANAETYDVTEIKCGGTAETSERDMIAGFFSLLSKLNPRLVTWNGRGFDLPVLMYRAMKYGIRAPHFYLTGDKWVNYENRYCGWHVDLMDLLATYGGSMKHRMAEVAAPLGIPCKVGMSGDEVQAAVDLNQLDAVRDYCLTDVLSTFLLYLKTQLHRGVMTAESYQQTMTKLSEVVELHQGEHFDPYRGMITAESAQVAEPSMN